MAYVQFFSGATKKQQLRKTQHLFEESWPRNIIRPDFSDESEMSLAKMADFSSESQIRLRACVKNCVS
jgi:hypothetical protein